MLLIAFTTKSHEDVVGFITLKLTLVIIVDI